MGIPKFLAATTAAARHIVAFDGEAHEALAGRLLRARKGDHDAAVTLLGEIAKWRVERVRAGRFAARWCLRGHWLSRSCSPRTPPQSLSLPPLTHPQRVAELAATPASELLAGITVDEVQFLHPKAYFPFPDKEGRPIYVEKSGLVDADVLDTLLTLDCLEAQHIMAFETDVRGLLALASRGKGTSVNSMVTLLDMNEMTLRIANASSRAYVKRMAAVDGANYPEMLGQLLIINAPSYFSAAWMMVKGFLDERTVSKIHIFSSTTAWKAKLFELIDPANVPTEYGGTLVVPGGLFRERCATAR